MIVHAYYLAQMCQEVFYLNENIKKMHRNDITIVCSKIWQFKQHSVSFS